MTRWSSRSREPPSAGPRAGLRRGRPAGPELALDLRARRGRPPRAAVAARRRLTVPRRRAGGGRSSRRSRRRPVTCPRCWRRGRPASGSPQRPPRRTRRGAVRQRHAAPAPGSARGGRRDASARPRDYREAQSEPVVAMAATSRRDNRDWFDLAVTVTVDGEDVPFDLLFVALASGQDHLHPPERHLVHPGPSGARRPGRP